MTHTFPTRRSADLVTFNVTITNSGDAAAEDVLVLINLPEGLQLGTMFFLGSSFWSFYERTLIYNGLDIPAKSHFFFQFTAKRSEEHTSELQSLMRISYAVFCLKKKTINTLS